MSNFNEDITIRILSENDLYDGIIVQSVGNMHCLYELKKVGNEYHQRVVRYVKNRTNHFHDKKLKDTGLYEVIDKEDKETFKKSNLNSWCETIYSRRYNFKEIREGKLVELFGKEKE